MRYNIFLKDMGLPIALMLGTLTMILGIISYSNNIPFYWTSATAFDFIGWIASCGVAYLIIRVLLPSHHKIAFLLLSALYLIVGVGVGNFFACVAFLASSYLLGSFAISFFYRDTTYLMHPTPGILVGTGVFLTIFGCLIHTHANTREVYWAIISLPLLLIFSSRVQQKIYTTAKQVLITKLHTLKTTPGLYLFAFIVLVTSVARFAFFPTIGYDDNAQHLRMWSELTNTGIYSFDVTAQIWSVAPFTVDLLHSIASLMADSDARGALNLLFFILLLLVISELSKLFLTDNKDRLLILALFSSTPIIANLLGSLQTELFLGLATVAGVRSIYLLQRHDVWASTLGVLFAAAISCSTKLPGAVISLLLVVSLITHLYANNTSLRLTLDKKSIFGLASLFLVFLFVALHPYINAWIKTHNPVFPLYNAIFKSPYFPLINFSDLRYQKGFSLKSYWSTFFRTGEFYEVRNFTAGFQYLTLFPIALLVAAFSKKRLLYVPLVFVGVGFGFIMFAASQYWRYLFPAIPIASVVIGLLLKDLSGTRKVSKAVVRVCIIFTIAVNLYFLPGASWFFTTPLQSLYSEAGKRVATEQLAPAKRIVQYVNLTAPGSKVFFDSDSPYGATLNGSPVFSNWYAPSSEQKIAPLESTADISNYMQTEGIQFVAWGLSLSGKQVRRDLIHNYLSEYGTPIYQSGSWILYRLSPTKTYYNTAIDLTSTLSAIPPSAASTTGIANETPHIIAKIETKGASFARYSVSFKCESRTGFFVAQVNWNKGPVYYKLLPCSDSIVSFTESILVPLGSSNGDVYITSRDATAISVKSLKIELN